MKREKGKQATMRWVKAHPERVAAKKREWAQANRERRNATSRAWHQAHPEQAAAYDRTWYQANHERRAVTDKIRNLKVNGFSRELYDGLLTEQQGRCAICDVTLVSGRSMDGAVADHDHRTGTHRAILCRQCNLALGHFKDNPSLLRKAAAYLESYLPLEFDPWPSGYIESYKEA